MHTSFHHSNSTHEESSILRYAVDIILHHVLQFASAAICVLTLKRMLANFLQNFVGP